VVVKEGQACNNCCETVFGPLFMLDKDAFMKSNSVDKKTLENIKQILCLQCYNDSSIEETI
jgi:hypothetical protein